MPRKKVKDWKQSPFSLSIDTIEKIKEISAFEGMSKTELIEHLVTNWEVGINPTEKIIFLSKQREELMEKIKALDQQMKEATRHLEMFESWKKQKKVRKQDAINILEKVILNKDFEEAEKVAKVWQRLTGVQALELLIEAKQNIERKGI